MRKNAECIQMESEQTRRKFIKALGVSGGGLTGLKFATEKVSGNSPDGVPIIWRRDIFGKPETIRFIPKERRRRIRLFYKKPGYFRKYSNKVNGTTITQVSDDPSDLSLKVYVEKDKFHTRRNIPNRVSDIPVIIEERKEKRDPHCDHSRYFYDPLPANVRIAGQEDGDTGSTGSMGIVCWNDDENDPYNCYITASHVISDDGPYEYLLHEGLYNGASREELVGEFVTRSQLYDSDGLDVAKYRRRSGTVDADPLKNAAEELSSISGYWDFEGLTDATTGSSTIGAEFSGRLSCYIDTDCYETETDSAVQYQANYSTDETNDGDSGGTYLDYDNYLIGTHYGKWSGGSAGPTARELLDRMNAVLYDPSEYDPYNIN